MWTTHADSASFPATRVLSALTAGYGVYALARPGHLAGALGEQPGIASRRLAYTYGVRDLAVSALALSGNRRLVPVAVALRVAGDLGDAAILSTSTTGTVRRKVLAVTTGWAAVNALAFALDNRRR